MRASASAAAFLNLAGTAMCVAMRSERGDVVRGCGRGRGRRLGLRALGLRIQRGGRRLYGALRRGKVVEQAHGASLCGTTDGLERRQATTFANASPGPPLQSAGAVRAPPARRHAAKARARSEDVIIDEDLTFKDLQLPVRTRRSRRSPRATAAPRPGRLTTFPPHPYLPSPQEPLVRGLADAGFRILSRPALGDPLGRLGADLVVQAKSGTGKTVTFGAILLDRVDRTTPSPGARRLPDPRGGPPVPRRHPDPRRARLDPPLRLHACLGGLPVAADRAVLARGCHAVVGTPGRVRQLLEEGALRPDGIRAFVIDEADALMGGSFEADVLFAHSMLPERKQVMAFSATYPDAMRRRLSRSCDRPNSSR